MKQIVHLPRALTPRVVELNQSALRTSTPAPARASVAKITVARANAATYPLVTLAAVHAKAVTLMAV